MSKLTSLRGPMSSLRWTDLAVFPLVLGLSVLPLLWFGRNWTVDTDPSRYLLLGWNLVSGAGYTFYKEAYTLRGPIFPQLLAGLMLLFGRDVEALAWTVRLLALANPMLMYFLIKRIAGPIAGLLAAAIVSLFGYTATYGQALNVDAVQLTVYLLAVLLLLVGSQKDSVVLSLLSGLLIGTAILTKETSIVLFPLALFTALLLGWSLRGILVHYTGIVAVCLPWWIWVWAVSGKVYLLNRLPSWLVILTIAAALILTLLSVMGTYKSGLVSRLLVSERWRGLISWSALLAPVAVLSYFILMRNAQHSSGSENSIFYYIIEELGQGIRLWYLLPFASAYVLWEAARGDRLWGFYLALLVLQIPIGFIVLQEQWAMRQWLIPQTLLYGALAGLVVKVLRASIRKEMHNPHRLLAFGAAAVLIIVLMQAAILQVQYLLEDEYNEVNDNNSRALSTSRNEFNSAVRDMHKWIAANIPDGEKIVVTRRYASQMAFLDGMQHEWALLQMDGCRGEPDGTCEPGSKKVAQAPPQPAVSFEMDENCNAMALSLTSLMQQMEPSDSTYLLTTQEKEPFPANLASAAYLKSSGAFEVVYSSYLPSATTTERYGLVLLKRTGQDYRSAPTLMKAHTIKDLFSCEKIAWGKRYKERIRTAFPNGIHLIGKTYTA